MCANVSKLAVGERGASCETVSLQIGIAQYEVIEMCRVARQGPYITFTILVVALVRGSIGLHINFSHIFPLSPFPPHSQHHFHCDNVPPSVL